MEQNAGTSCATRIGFWALAVLFTFFAVFLFLQILPFYKSLGSDEDLFYGKVSSLAFPRGWSGSGIPLLDRQYFHLNEDRDASFWLALSPGEWKAFKPVMEFWAETEMPEPVGVRAKRIGDLDWVVTEISGTDWSLDSSEIVEFHERALFWYTLLELLLVVAAIFAIRKSSRRAK